MFDDLIGKPWGKNAKGPDAFDCYGLCMEVYRRLGRELPSHDYIEDVAARTKAIRLGFAQGTRRLERVQPHCLVIMRIKGYASHVGVVLEDGKRFIHVLRKRMVTIERLSERIWTPKIEGFYEYLG